MTVQPPALTSRLVALDGRPLALLDASLHVDASAGLAHIRLRQRFLNPYAEPLRVLLQVPLPADAAVMGFSFEQRGQRVVGEIDRRSAARERFEEAIIEGRSAALLEEDRSSLFSQEVGNLPPGEELVCELELDQLLTWEGQGWTLRFPLTVAPRYLGADGRVPDAERLAVDVAQGPTPPRLRLVAHIADVLTGPVSSPSHAIVQRDRQVGLFDEGGVPLDRDLVLRWPVAAPGPGLSLALARAGAERAVSSVSAGLLSLVPPTVPGPALPRDLVLLLDTSGSMGGAPLAQAVAVSLALVDSLGPQDQLQMVEFSLQARAWLPGPVAATPDNRARATQWLRSLRAGGGTEMKSGILAALACLRGEAQRQVVLLTDGLIGFEQEIVGEIARRLPRGCRVHTVGIGSGVNRSLLAPAARAGAGVEVIIGLEDAPSEAAARLVQATAAPLVVDLELSGSALLSCAHHRAPDLLAGRPARLALSLRPEGGLLRVRGWTASGLWERELTVAPVAPGEGNPALLARLGRERAEELELRAAQGESVDRELERVGLDWRISTRLTSWVAVSEQITVDPTLPGRRERLPQALPHGLSVEGLGLRGLGGSVMPMACAAPPPSFMPAPSGGAPRPARPQASITVEELSRSRRALAPQDKAKKESASPGSPASPPAERDDSAEVAHRYHDARIVLAKGERLVVEVDVTDLDVVWRQPGAQVPLRLSDGRRVVATLDAATSTKKGWLRKGEILRVVLVGPDLGALAALIEEIEVDADTVGGILRLHLFPKGRR